MYIGTMLYQQTNQFHVMIDARPMQGCGSSSIYGIHIGPVLQEQFHQVQIALKQHGVATRLVQGRIPVMCIVTIDIDRRVATMIVLL